MGLEGKKKKGWKREKHTKWHPLIQVKSKRAGSRKMTWGKDVIRQRGSKRHSLNRTINTVVLFSNVYHFKLGFSNTE